MHKNGGSKPPPYGVIPRERSDRGNLNSALSFRLPHRQSARHNAPFSASGKFRQCLGFSSPHKGRSPLRGPLKASLAMTKKLVRWRRREQASARRWTPPGLASRGHPPHKCGGQGCGALIEGDSSVLCTSE